VVEKNAAFDEDIDRGLQDSFEATEQLIETSVHPSLSIHAQIHWLLWTESAYLRNTPKS